MVILAFLVFTGTPLIIKPLTAMLLLLVYFVTLSNQDFLARMIGVISYIILSYGFIRSAIDILFPPKAPQTVNFPPY